MFYVASSMISSASTRFACLTSSTSHPQEHALGRVRRMCSFLKASLTSAPTLLIPDPSKTFFLSTDAFGVAVGAVLEQLSAASGEEILPPVAYYESRRLKNAERRWPVREQDRFAIIHALTKWRHYLLSSPVYVLTDHESLRFVLSQTTVKGRIARWLYLLADFDLRIGYRPGR